MLQSTSRDGKFLEQITFQKVKMDWCKVNNSEKEGRKVTWLISSASRLVSTTDGQWGPASVHQESKSPLTCCLLHKKWGLVIVSSPMIRTLQGPTSGLRDLLVLCRAEWWPLMIIPPLPSSVLPWTTWESTLMSRKQMGNWPTFLLLRTASDALGRWLLLLQWRRKTWPAQVLHGHSAPKYCCWEKRNLGVFSRWGTIRRRVGEG